jgi:hypothetical protein
LNEDFLYIVRNGNISQQIPSGIYLLIPSVMPDSLIIGKGIANNVILPIEMPHGIEIGKSCFLGSMNISSDKN